MGAAPGVAPVRVVLDTTVVLSAILFAEGRLGWLRRAWQQEQVVPVVNRHTAAELLRVLAYPKFRLDSREQEDVLAEYLPYCEVASPAGRVAAPSVRDAQATAFLQLALSSQVEYLVTGDADLLTLAGDMAATVVKIVTPEQFRQAIGV